MLQTELSNCQIQLEVTVNNFGGRFLSFFYHFCVVLSVPENARSASSDLWNKQMQLTLIAPPDATRAAVALLLVFVEASQVLNSWCRERSNLSWNQAREKHVFTHPAAAAVKFAHSHAFFVSLTFHVEAKASPGAIFLPASLTQ